MRSPRTLRNLLTHFATICLFALAVSAQSTAFSYQGSLTDNGSQANGSFQMRFRLFDASNGGTQIGNTLADIAVTATQGTFSIRLDFGTNAWSGQDRWLEIAVRRNAGESYTTLSPRQQIASAPYSIRTLSAAQADISLDSQKLGGLNANEYVTNSSLSASFIRNQTSLQSPANFNISGDGYFGGRIGIGTTSPAGLLHLQSTATFAPVYLTSAAGFASQSSWRLQPDAGIAGQGAAFGVYSNTAQAYRMFINGSGNVGIGTTAPTSRLDIVAQDGVQITGFQPFLTFRDSNNANLGARIQSADGKLIFRPNVFGSVIPAAVIEPNGFIGIGTTAPRTVLDVNGSIFQNRTGHGVVKAMALIKDDNTVVRCFNSQATGAAITTPPCNITVTFETDGNYLIDFGFQVSDRYILLTPRTLTDGATAPVNVTATVAGVTNVNQTRAYFRSSSGARSGFFIYVF